MKRTGNPGSPSALPITWLDKRFFPSKHDERMRKFEESVGLIESLLETAHPGIAETVSATVPGLHREAHALLLEEETDPDDRDFVIRTLLTLTALDPTLLDETRRVLEIEDCAEEFPPWIWTATYTLQSLQLEFSASGIGKEAWVMMITKRIEDAQTEES